jgi:AcrR family transcriptional regulator
MSEDTVERILDAALAQISDHGMRRTTMEDIAGAARLARPTLYEYFPNKDALLTAAITRELGRFLEELDAVGRGAADPEEALVAVFVHSYTYLRDDPLTQRLLRTEPQAILPFVTREAPGLELGYRWAAAHLHELAGSAGSRPTRRERELGEMLIRVMHSLVLSPPSSIDLSSERAMQAFARAWLVPWLRAGLASG